MIPNLVVTEAQYRKIHAYANKEGLSLTEAIRALIDTLPDDSPDTLTAGNKESILQQGNYSTL